MPEVEFHILICHKECGTNFHTIARALGYDSTTHERILVRWKKCQDIYDHLTTTRKSDRHPSAIVYYEGLNEKDKATRADIVREGLRRAEYVINRTELMHTQMRRAEKSLKRAELKEQERTTRRQRCAEIMPGK